MSSHPRQVVRSKAFLAFSQEMTDISTHLRWVAFVQAFGQVDDIGSTLAHKAHTLGSWTTRKLVRDNESFVSCLSYEVVQGLMALGHIRGEGFTLLVYHWDQTRLASHHNLCFKASISLLNLPLICWNPEAVARFVAGFEMPFRASQASTSWEDLSSFDFSILCKEPTLIPNFMDVSIGPFSYPI